MLKKTNLKLAGKILSLLLVVTVTFVYVISPNFAHIKLASAQQFLQNKFGSFSEDANAVSLTGIRSEKDLKLAVSTTAAGQSGLKLREGYEQLNTAFENGDDIKEASATFSSLISEVKDENAEELSTTDNNTTEFNDYKLSVMENFDKLEKLSNSLSADNADSVLEQIKDLVAAEKPCLSLADNLPFSELAETEVPVEEYEPTESLPAVTDENRAYSQEDLDFTNDTVINDNIRDSFKDCDSVLKVYQNIKNNYMPEFYYGSRKGAVGAYEQKAGNDYDLSSLLIGLLRDRSIPARYVRGEIEITAKQAQELTGTDNINTALKILASLGTPVTSLNMNGEVAAVRIEHV